jgi:hypothetical protein
VSPFATLCACVTFAAVALLNVGGHLLVSGFSETSFICAHGWPCEFLRRDALVDSNGYGPAVGVWPWGNGVVVEYKPLALAVDVGFALSVAAFAYLLGRAISGRNFRFRLTMLLGVMFLGAAFCAYVRRCAVWHVRERATVAEAGRLGIHVRSESVLPTWACEAFGMRGPCGWTRIKAIFAHQVSSLDDRRAAAFIHSEWTAEVEYVNLEHCAIGEECVRALSSLPKLKRLSLWFAGLGDNEITLLSSASLSELNLWNTRVTDSGIRMLGGRLPALRLFLLGGTSVCGTGFSSWADCDNLREVHLGGNRITCEGLNALGRIPQLNALSLAYAKLDAGCADTLLALAQSKRLDLQRAEFSGAVPVPLRRLLDPAPHATPQSP